MEELCSKINKMKHIFGEFKIMCASYTLLDYSNRERWNSITRYEKMGLGVFSQIVTSKEIAPPVVQMALEGINAIHVELHTKQQIW